MTNDRPKKQSGRFEVLRLILMYPTLIITLITTVVTFLFPVRQYLEAKKANVTYTEGPFAKQQKMLWDRNATCLVGKLLTATDAGHNIETSSVACESGDVLIKVRVPGPPRRTGYHWIAVEEVKRLAGAWTAASAGPSTTAVVAPARPIAESAGDVTIICQKQISAALVKLRVRNTNGRCFDKVINKYKGKVVGKRKPAPCDGNC